MAAVLRGEGELASVRSSDLLRKGETFFPTRERSGGDLDTIPPGFRLSAARSRAGPSEIPSPDSCSKSHPGLPSCNTGGKVREGEQPGSPSPAPSPAEVRPFPALRGRITKVWVRSESQFPTVASQSERARDNGKASITAWQIACELPGDNTPLPKEQIVPQVGGPPVTLPSPGISHLCNEGGRTRQDPGLELPWSNINLFFPGCFKLPAQVCCPLPAQPSTNPVQDLSCSF